MGAAALQHPCAELTQLHQANCAGMLLPPADPKMGVQVLWWLLLCILLWYAPAAQLLDTCTLECQLAQQLELVALYSISGAGLLGQSLLLCQHAVESQILMELSGMQEALTGSRALIGSMSQAARWLTAAGRASLAAQSQG